MSLLFLQTPPHPLKYCNNHSATGLETLPDPLTHLKNIQLEPTFPLWLILEPPLGGKMLYKVLQYFFALLALLISDLYHDKYSLTQRYLWMIFSYEPLLSSFLLFKSKTATQD